MFFRITKGKAKDYAYIVEGYRDKDGKVKQRRVANLGVVTDENREQLQAIGRRIVAHTTEQEIISNPEDIQEVNSENWGAGEVVTALSSRFALDKIIKRDQDKEALKLLLINRFMNPSSKLRAFNHRYEYSDCSHIQLHELYKVLDLLSDKREDLKGHLFKKQVLYGAQDIVFFDVTTLYFESHNSDELREFGYSKDCKFNEVQIILSMIINSEGRPLTYEIFPGNIFEGNTLLPILQRLKEQFQINKVVIVADRGIGSQSNLQQLKAAGFDYIIGAKLKSASQEVQACAIDNEGFSIMHNNEEDSISYKMMKNKLDDWIILHSTKRARKDVYDRERLIERAKETLDNARLHSKTGAKKFIKSVNKQKYELDLEKIEKEKQYDGYYALSFSDKTMSASEITDAYHSLWRIEESFRTIKSFFEVRPMFHWTPSRIHGHIMLNFIALVLQKDLELKLKSQDTNASQQAIRDAMHGMRRSIIKINRSQYYIYSKISVLAQNILQSINLKPRSNVKI